MRDLTIVFDLDGTLVDTAPDLIGATNHVMGLVALDPVPGETLRPWISFGARRMIIGGIEAAGAMLPDTEIDRLLNLFLAHYADNIARFSRPFPGALDALERLAAQGATLAVCTNKREGLARSLLDELGLTHFFTAIAGRDTFAESKPHPDHLLKTILMAGGNPRRSLMIGDSEVDVATAKAANVPVIGVTFGYTDVPMQSLAPDALIENYAGLIPAIEAWQDLGERSTIGTPRASVRGR